MSTMPHTRVARGKRVAVQLRNGQLVDGQFHQRAKNNRWIEVWVAFPGPCGTDWQLIRIPKTEIVSFSPIKGLLDHKRLGRKP
jgi:hypothetical protein